MMKKISTFILFLCICFADENSQAFEMVNKYRQSAGMINFGVNGLLESSATNHSNYMATNNVSGHYEDNTSQGFTGDWASDRAYSVGYKSGVSENVSSGGLGQHSVYDSVAGLYSAIYHRFGFLSFDLDEMGVGISSNGTNSYYTYNMGNYSINALCESGGYSGWGGYYVGICTDDTNKAVDLDTINYTKIQNPKIVIWPPKDSNFTEPVFYEESPDPLPNQSVSGYPVSIQFNDYFLQNVKINSFKLLDYDSNLDIDTIYLNAQNDPNAHFQSNEFAIFPKERLGWGSVYKAEVNYEVDDVNQTISWCYETLDYPYKRYEITASNLTLDVVSGHDYMLYFKPKDVNDTSYGFGTSGYFDSLDIDFIDANTLYVKVKGNIGDSVDISLANGMEVTVKVSNNDEALEVKDNSYKLLECSNGNTSIVENNQSIDIKSSWNLIAFPVDVNVTYDELNSTFQTAQTIWIYQDEWLAYGKGETQTLLNNANISKIITIQKAQGFWINSLDEDNVTFSGNDYDVTSHESLTFASSGWHLLGSGSDVNVSQIVLANADISTIWAYKNSWSAYGSGNMQNLLNNANIPQLTTIERGQGFWVNVK